MKLEDEDGVDGPFERGMKAFPRKATSKRKALAAAIGASAEVLRQKIESDVRPADSPSRLCPVLTVGKIKEVFLRALEDVETSRPFNPRYVERRDGRGATPNVDLLTAANIFREFGL